MNAHGLLLCCGLAACSSLPGLDDPRISLEPRLTLYTLDGATRMQSVGAGGIQNNGTMSLDEFGLTDRDEDLMGIVGYGDGFSGFELGYQNVRMESSNEGLMTADWGDLDLGDNPLTGYFMEEYRLAYIAEIFSYETEQEARLRFGLGGALVHRDAKLRAKDADDPRGQSVKIEDNGIPYLCARARAEYLGVSLQLDGAYNPDAAPGGDYVGDLFDVEVRVGYHLEDQDVTLVGGYRSSDLQSSGTEGFLEWDNDLRLEGFFFGLSFLF